MCHYYNKNNILHFGTAYRSPNSTDDNNQAVLNFISKLSACPGYKLLLGDFNCPNINWDTWCASSPFELKFVDTLRKNFLIQYVDKPTRARGVDTPHTLDLIITEENFLQNLSYESPCIWVKCDVRVCEVAVYTKCSARFLVRGMGKVRGPKLRGTLLRRW